MNTPPKQRPPSRGEKLDDLIAEMKRVGVLRTPAELSEEVSMPAALAAALMTGRPQLIKLAEPQALDIEDCRRVYHLVGTLIETNMLLREHAQTLGKLVGYWTDHFKGLHRLGAEIENFAEFKTANIEAEKDAA